MEHVCEYCGQVISVIADSPEEAREIALGMCQCGGAERYRKVVAAHAGIDEVFGEGAEDELIVQAETLAVLKRTVEAMIDGHINGATIKIGWGQAAGIGKNGKGEIELTRKRSQTRKLTV